MEILNVMSVTDYAKLETVNLTRQGVLAQIKEGRLPSGVSATLIGKTWIIHLPVKD